MNSLAIVRDRGQLTIPDSVRQTLDWLSPQSVISITVVNTELVVLSPHTQKPDWDGIWKKMHSLQKVRVDGARNTSDFLVHDRQAH